MTNKVLDEAPCCDDPDIQTVCNYCGNPVDVSGGYPICRGCKEYKLMPETVCLNCGAHNDS